MPVKASSAWRLGCGLALLIGAPLGCRDHSPTLPSPQEQTVAAAKPAPLPPHSPMTQAELPSTDGEIAIGNLEASLSSAKAILGRRPQDGVAYAHYVTMLIGRGQYLGRIADYEEAATVAESAVKAAPNDMRSFLSRAETRSIFHDFPGALADLDQVAPLAKKAFEDVPTSFIEARRTSIVEALGKSDDALAIAHKVATAHPDIMALAGEAVIYAERGDIAPAETLFIEAQHHYADVAPFPIVWLYLQEGLMWESAGNLPRAKELYAAAHDRLPAYAAATSHLAGILAAQGQRQPAIELLRPLLKSSDDPEYVGQLAGLLQEAGQKEEADRLAATAKSRYAELLARHPLAFAAHAARFYLGAGGDPKAAAQWAEKNLAARKSPDAYSLAVEATDAAGDATRACALADEMGVLPYQTARMHVMAARAYQACKKPDRATAELAKAAVR